MTRRIQCGGSSLEIDPLTGELTFEDFLNTAEPPEQDPMPVPKIDVGSTTVEVFGNPIIDALFSDVFDKLDLFKQDINKFIEMLKEKTKNAINWGLALVGVTTVSGLMVVIVREITMAIQRWQREKEYKDSLKPENRPSMISKEDMDAKDEISELSGEDLEPPSLGEYEEPVYDENGNAMLNPDGSQMTKTVVIPLDRDISDQYDPIPEPEDISEEELEPEDEEVEDELIEVNDQLINDLMEEFDPQYMQNLNNIEFDIDDGVYVLHIKNIIMKRHCIAPGDRIAWECKMLKDIIQPTIWDRYKHTYTYRMTNCNKVRGIGYPITIVPKVGCCGCNAFSSQLPLEDPRIIPNGQPTWYGNACTCVEKGYMEEPCDCNCHVQSEEAVKRLTYECSNISYGPIAYAYGSDCVVPMDFITKIMTHKILGRIIRYESEEAKYPYSAHEWCDYCKVMKKYYDKTKYYKYHKTNTDAYIFFTRGEKSTIFERCKELFSGIASDKEGNLLSDWDQGSNKVFEYRGINCKCDVPRPTCTGTYVGWSSEIHTNSQAYLKGHAQTVKWIYLPDFDTQSGDPWWYNDPHDYQSISKVCPFVGFLEQNVPSHVIRFYVYRRLLDKTWFPTLYKKICEAVLFNYPDIPAGSGPAAQKWKDYHIWGKIAEILNDVVPIAEIYPEQILPMVRLFNDRPANWDQLKQRGANWTGEVEPELAPFKRYLDLLNKYYPGWWDFRDTQELGWWDEFWTQIPDLGDLERTSIFYYSDLTFDSANWEIYGEPPWWRGFWGPTIRDKAPDPERPRNYNEVLDVVSKY